MRIITLNVNGLRSAERKGFARWLARAEPWDVVCLQEIRCADRDVPRSLAAPRKSHAAFHPAQRSGYSKADWEVWLRHTPVDPNGEIRCALVYMDSGELLDGAANFLAGFDAQIDGRVGERRSHQHS